MASAAILVLVQVRRWLWIWLGGLTREAPLTKLSGIVVTVLIRLPDRHPPRTLTVVLLHFTWEVSWPQKPPL